MRGGKDYDSEWGVRMRGSGPYAELIGNRFALAAKKFGFTKQRLKLDTSQFKSPKNFGNQLTFIVTLNVGLHLNPKIQFD